ncbi:aldose epimerase family protein [Paraglaciecola sp. 2405UD69-4]|uniref:aldose epimerase family protein n=1 Tax=Paraglaciecola sp. 2405UD69-4 TaxID=3391836 RepID=UPI0039C995B9
MITQTPFGTMPNGHKITQFTLTNAQGVSIEILTLGGVIRRWLIPTTEDTATDIVLGYDTLEEYIHDDSSLGALIGRYANRIAKGQFTLDGTDYQTDINLGEHCLHGGSQGFSKQIWDSSILSDSENPSILLELQSRDGDQGFPGDIHVKVIYTLTEHNKLKIEYFANASKSTVFNPTNHSYFNLEGHKHGSVEDHQIQVLASQYTPIDNQGVPTGEIVTVDETPFDFRPLTSIHQPLSAPNEQIQFGNGLDHNLCLDYYSNKARVATYAAQAQTQDGKVTLKVYTNMPGIQIFTANHLRDKKGKDNALYQARHGVCFETQFYADSPNKPHFPSTKLEADEEFYSITEYEVLF